MEEQRLTHFDASGRARMVDVGAKAETERIAVAHGAVEMQPETLRLILEGRAKKGDVLAVAQVAGIMAAKRTHETAEEVSRVGDATENTRANVATVRSVAEELGAVAHRIRDQIESFSQNLRAA